MKLARKFIAFCATILCFLLVACSANKIDGNSTFGDYISITTTSKSGEELTVSLYVYDIQQNDAEKIFSFPYTAKYSLGAVDLYDNTIYFSKNDNIDGDQLVRYDLETKRRENIMDKPICY